MLRSIEKVTILAVMAAIFAFAFACTAFAEETEKPDQVPGVEPVQLEEPDLPVGGWAPAEAICVPEDLDVPGGGVSADGLKSSKSRIKSDPNNVFTKGAASTGYNALGSEQKKIYDGLNLVADMFMNAEEDLQPTEVTQDGADVERYIINWIDYSELEISGEQEALKAFYAFQYDHPGYYWLSNLVLYNAEEKKIYPCTEPEYASVSTRQRINALVSSSVKVYVELAENEDYNLSTLDKIAIVHDKIVNDIDYAYQSDGSTPEPAKWAHSVHGVFDPNYKHAVCEGYADAFALIMNYMEIPNYYIVGKAAPDDSSAIGGHAWNAVYNDEEDPDKRCYLYMDLTWDDWGKNDAGEDLGYTYEYFGMPAEHFERSHYRYTSSATQAEEWLYDIGRDIDRNYNNDFEGTYYKRGGFYYGGNTDANVLAAAKAKAARAGGWVSVIFPDPCLRDAIVDALGLEPLDYIVDYGGYVYSGLRAPLGNKHDSFDTHDWTNPVYVWSTDNREITAFCICKAPNCKIVTEMETAKVTMTDNTATCTADGQALCSATFANPAFWVDPEERTIKALGHSWNAPTYQWASDYGKVTASRECARENCTETETETAKTTSRVTRKPTYTVKGQTTYTAAFTNPAFAAKKTVTNIPVLAKKAQPMKIKAVTKTVKYSKVKKKAQTVSGSVKFTKKAQGTVTYKGVGTNAKSKKALTINKKNGKITVKKKTKKGTYKMKVTVTAAGNKVYKKGSKTVTVTIKVQ